MLLRGIIFCLYFVLINSIYAGSFISGDNVTISYSETPTNIIITGEDFDYRFDELKAMEVNIFHYPMIFTSGIDMNIDPNIYNYIIFTSKNGVKYFLKNISTSINRDIKFICIKEK